MKSKEKQENGTYDLSTMEKSGQKYMVSTEENSTKLLGNKKKLLVTLCILITEMCERLTYYSISAGILLFCTSKLNYAETDATTINQVFAGIAYIIPIAGGFIADTFAGRFKTIMFASMLYIIGTLLIPASAVAYETWGWEPLKTDAKKGIFMTGLLLVAIGTGGIKANVGPFGAEQVESMGKDTVQVFFNWFYWVINVGALIAFAGVSYIQQNISFAWGFFVPLVSMSLALVIFVTARSKYVKTEPNGSVLTTTCSILGEGISRSPPESSQDNDVGSRKFLWRAKQSYGGSHEDHLVDGVVSVIRVTPFCLLVIMYWAIYSQMSNTFFAQSERMDIRIGDDYLPAAALNVFNTICIIILIPIVDRLVYPAFEKMGRPLTYLKRIGIGMILSVMAVVVAGIVEIYRKEDMENFHVQVLGDKMFNASSMSVFIQVPQFALIGASEIFAAISTLEFAYNQAPVAMQGLLTGLFLASSGIGNWVSTAILAIVKAATVDYPWWCDDINTCHMEYLMFLLGGLMFLNFLVFCVVAKFFTYQDPATFEKAIETDVVKDGHINDQEGVVIVDKL
uniref:Major facilitator superfamily (MFS) profile domain-containing protein n=1 Tax=Arion vulgaris TaxID=1028688 RepID=A0A0B7AD16_9EUPU